jgi:hypothetical protein
LFGDPLVALREQRIACLPGQAVVGIHGRSGILLDALGVICADVTARMSSDLPSGLLLDTAEHIRIPAFGGSGGDEFSFICPDGSVALGYRGRTGDLADAVGIACARIDTSFWGLFEEAPATGGAEGDEPAEVPDAWDLDDLPQLSATEETRDSFQWACPRGYAISTLDLFQTTVPAPVIGRVRPRCRPLRVEGLEDHPVGAGIDGRELGRADTRVQGRSGCPNGQFAIGMHGLAESYVDRVGLVCGGLRVPIGGQYDAGALLEVVDTSMVAAFGGDGGEPFEQLCPQGSVVVAIGGRATRAVEGLSIYCRELTPRELTTDDE